jgi:hypothetical protein
MRARKVELPKGHDNNQYSIQTGVLQRYNTQAIQTNQQLQFQKYAVTEYAANGNDCDKIRRKSPNRREVSKRRDATARFGSACSRLIPEVDTPTSTRGHSETKSNSSSERNFNIENANFNIETSFSRS